MLACLLISPRHVLHSVS